MFQHAFPTPLAPPLALARAQGAEGAGITRRALLLGRTLEETRSVWLISENTLIGCPAHTLLHVASIQEMLNHGDTDQKEF
jgi:hypothetical protein